MKDHIYTLPVTDAFKDEKQCPFCSMKKEIEEKKIAFITGPAYMEDDIRVVTNEQGFCQIHLQRLQEERNQLGLALMLHTHLKQRIKELEAAMKDNKPKATKGLFKKNAISTSPVNEFMEKHSSNCYVCKEIEDLYARYYDTFFYLLKKDPDFWTLLENNASGFCLQHFTDLIEDAPNKLSSTDSQRLLNLVIPNQLEKLQTLEEDLHYFTLKFDYRYKDAPWKNSKDAIQRTINTL